MREDNHRSSKNASEDFIKQMNPIFGKENITHREWDGSASSMVILLFREHLQLPL